mmetsp:Transcript_12166/g.30383  ORF Transcript_12166/g.30383 Transcript_12166/m.30383 type:complete len:202 (-) Transcript_12166:685-1290(-)
MAFGTVLEPEVPLDLQLQRHWDRATRHKHLHLAHALPKHFVVLLHLRHHRHHRCQQHRAQQESHDVHQAQEHALRHVASHHIRAGARHSSCREIQCRHVLLPLGGSAPVHAVANDPRGAPDAGLAGPAVRTLVRGVRFEVVILQRHPPQDSPRTSRPMNPHHKEEHQPHPRSRCTDVLIPQSIQHPERLHDLFRLCNPQNT